MSPMSIHTTRRALLGMLGRGAAGAVALGGWTPATAQDGTARGPDRGELAGLLEPIRARHNLPALAGAIVTRQGPVALGAVGVRKAGDQTSVTTADQFHIGSDTKAMTATLLARFVEAGAVAWDTTLEAALPAFARAMRPEYRAVTVAQLLAHRAGFSGETAAPGASLAELHTWRGSPREQRRRYVERIVKDPPADPPGTSFVYSNRSYIAAGVIAEELADQDWETLITERLFQPLGMASAGFGAMGTPRRVDQPWPHTLVGGRPRPIPPGPRGDNPAVLGPAGRVHCSLGDWGRFIALHLNGAEGRAGLLLKPETIRRMHQPEAGGDYGFGWIIVPRDWGGGLVLNHAGSNTMNYAVVWAAPTRGFAVLAATNLGGEPAATACDEAASALIGHHLGLG